MNAAIWWKSFFRVNFACNLGYRMESQRRTIAHTQYKYGEVLCSVSFFLVITSYFAVG
jgi:hypothetical protein